MAELMTKSNVPEEILEELLTPGYSDCECGWKQWNEDYTLTCVYVRFSYCKGEAIKWWFSDGMKNLQAYQMWNPGHTGFEWYNKKPHEIYGAAHYLKETLDGEPREMINTFVDPVEIIGDKVKRFQENNISACICGETHDLNHNVIGVHIHMVRDTYFGCELRNRFFSLHGTPEGCKNSIRHNLQEMGSLAEFLPGYYLRENYEPLKLGKF